MLLSQIIYLRFVLELLLVELSYISNCLVNKMAFTHLRCFYLKGGGHLHFHNAFLVPMLSLGDVETRNSIYKIFKTH